MIIILACIAVAAFIIALSIFLRKIANSIVCDDCPNKSFCKEQEELDKDFVPPCDNGECSIQFTNDEII